ncbi:hypothetical protein NP233_g7811 [Leucocoprinus birnbaumii]|uniref:Dihydrofolate synthetase n=1 Tax=Leucocoprinus birnbaumii TaxID=56174 RepID=A0AAD5YNM7_9AGAR|nr:hypothetical protein NP233_g7811 [Leucocoprinus birnbaumii]
MSIDLSLDRLRLAIQHLPKYTRPTCHVAGTNGKGSVTAIISSIFRSASPPLKVGRYNSPHLVSVTDCIIINDEPVDSEAYSSVRNRVERIDGELGTRLSNFELLTLTALQIFEMLEVDVAVVEVGMGGRLDATNIIPDEAILGSGLTSVDLDHQAFLGNTVSAIAREKAAIARPGKPFVIGEQKYPEAVEVANATVLENKALIAPLLVPPRTAVSFRFPPFNKDITTELPLHGMHQIDNLATALSIISVLLMNEHTLQSTLLARLSPSSLRRGISDVQWRGRLSFHTISSPRPLSLLVDGAHNAASAETLANYLQGMLSRSIEPVVDLVYIIALSHSPPKTPLDTLSPLLPPNLSDARVRFHVALINFSPPDGMPWVKPVAPNATAEVVKELVPEIDLWVADQSEEPGTQLRGAIRWGAERIGDAGLIVIAGSLYLVADFYRSCV